MIFPKHSIQLSWMTFRDHFPCINLPQVFPTECPTFSPLKFWGLRCLRCWGKQRVHAQFLSRAQRVISLTGHDSPVQASQSSMLTQCGATHFLQPVVLFLKPVVSHGRPPAYKIKCSLWLGSSRALHLSSDSCSITSPYTSISHMLQALRLFLCTFSLTCPCPHASLNVTFLEERSSQLPLTLSHSSFFNPSYS